VSGNHDLGVVEAYEHPDQDGPLTWRIENARQLERRHIEYLKSLPDRLVLELDGEAYGITHAYRGYDTIRSSEAFLHFSEERFSRNLQRMVFGHTHRRELHYVSDAACWLNAGSVSYRRDDEVYRGAHYAVILDGEISLRSVPYPSEKLHHAVLASSVCDREKQTTLQWWAPI
jgi:predicted phosphodiesterase